MIKTPFTILEKAAKEAPNNIALTRFSSDLNGYNTTRTITYEQLLKQVESVNLGISEGSIVGIMSNSRADIIESILKIDRNNGIPLLIDPMQTRKGLEEIAVETRPIKIIASEEFIPKLGSVPSVRKYCDELISLTPITIQYGEIELLVNQLAGKKEYYAMVTQEQAQEAYDFLLKKFKYHPFQYGRATSSVIPIGDDSNSIRITHIGEKANTLVPRREKIIAGILHDMRLDKRMERLYYNKYVEFEEEFERRSYETCFEPQDIFFSELKKCTPTEIIYSFMAMDGYAQVLSNDTNIEATEINPTRILMRLNDAYHMNSELRQFKQR
ncbi:hypothetical protein JXM83_02310 [Candidatus Woesearchaeota archaeon]|nr:hypothetical protein [Candidatus Woesearchaeota archaeon]